MNLKSALSRVLPGGGTPDALDVLRADHREVEVLFHRALDGTGAARRSALKKIVEALTVHAQMEERLFYPALQEALKRAEREPILEAYEEHAVVKDLIAKIERLEGRADETLHAKVTVLKELVQHHVREEESTIFHDARRVFDEDELQTLGTKLLRFKERALEGGGTRKRRARR